MTKAKHHEMSQELNRDQLAEFYRQHPAILGQEILARLEARNIAPTPAAYQAIYEELSGQKSQPQQAMMESPSRLESSFRALTRRLARNSNEAGMRLAYAIENDDWATFVDGVVSLVDASAQQQSRRSRFADFGESKDGAHQWQEQVAKLLTYTIPALLQDEAELAVEVGSLGMQVKAAVTAEEVQKAIRSINELSYRISLVSEDEFGRQKAFLRLLNLTLDSLAEVIDSDTQVASEVKNFQKIVNAPWNENTLDQAARQLKSIVVNQRNGGASY